MGDATVTFETKIPLTEYFRAAITNMSNMDSVDWVRTHLTPNQLTIFRSSCLGWCLDIRDFVFLGTVVHNVLFREVVTNGLENEIWFLIQGMDSINFFLFFFLY
jgi:hypothetical protein